MWTPQVYAGTSLRAIARSSAAVMPRAAVPFIGRDVSAPSSSEKNNSGDAETIANSSDSSQAE